ncbi:MAG: DsrE family protein [Betaproteobacteria bacterium]|nr:DsrE family protein [Betaproteobacteria bacterium]
MQCNGCEFRPELYYDSEFQIWVRVEADGALAVGMTDISQTIAGKILHVRVRRPGTPRPAGRPVATMEGVKLCQKGVAEHLTAIDGGKTIIEFMRDAKAAGVRFYLCRPALPGYEMEIDSVIDEVDELSSGGELADLILSCDKALFF